MLPMLLNISQDYDSNLFLYNDDSQLLRNNLVKEIYDPYLPKSILNSWKDKNDDKIYTYIFIEQEEISDRWIDLYLKFDDSFKQKKHLFPNISSCKIEDDFKKSLENILSFLPETISVGVSDDECVYIYFEKDNKSVYLDLFFEPEKKTEASITVFENKVSKLSFTDYLDNSINKIRNEFITENELSCQTSAAI
jgi:predicted HTH domain antitoxin